MHILIGVPGAGKTTLGKEVCEKAGIELVNIGDKIHEIAVKEGFEGNRDEMRRQFSKKRLTELQVKAFEEIIEIEKEGKEVMVDTHALIPLGNGLYQNGFPFGVHDVLKGKVDLWIFVFVSPTVLIERAKNDSARSRGEMMDEKFVKELITLERSSVINYMIIMGGYFFDVNNDGPKGSKVPDVLKALKR